MAERSGGARVAVVGLGGTIAMTRSESGGVVPALGADELLAEVPGLAETGIGVETHDFRRLPGASVGFADVLGVLSLVEERVRAGVTGVVVTQGTDTIEETSYLLDLVHTGSAPVVVTGAMRNPTMAGADGPANLLAAIHVAASPLAQDLGALVVFADQIHSARRVHKAHTSSTGAFVSPDTGPVGHVVEDRVHLLARPGGRVSVPVPSGDALARIGMVTVGMDDGGEILGAIAEGNLVDGLVLAGLGAGHVPEALVPVVADLAARMPVVLASRTGAGTVLADTYGFAGSERDLLGRGLISAGYLHPAKARVLLRLLLTNSANHPDIEKYFCQAGSARSPM